MKFIIFRIRDNYNKVDIYHKDEKELEIFFNEKEMVMFNFNYFMMNMNENPYHIYFSSSIIIAIVIKEKINICNTGNDIVDEQIKKYRNTLLKEKIKQIRNL